MSSTRRFLTFFGTEVCSPFVLATALIAVVAFTTDPYPWLATAVPVLFIVVVPLSLSLWLARSGKVTDRFIVQRRQRHQFYAVSLCSAALGVLLVSVLPFGTPVKLSIWTILVILVLVSGVNFAIKISVHALVAAFFAVSIPYFAGSWLWLLATLPIWAVAAWSRVAMGKHTVREVSLGSAAGAVSAAIYLSLLAL